MNTQPPDGKGSPAASWLLAKANPKVESRPMTSPVLRISGPSTESASGKRLKGRTASFTATYPSLRGAQQALVAQLAERGADHDPGGDLDERDAGGLGHEGDGAAGARVGLDQEDLAVLHGVPDVDQPDHLALCRDGSRVLLEHRDGVRPQRVRRAPADVLAPMDPRPPARTPDA